MTTDSVRVMLVDDHTMVRKGLATFLKIFDDLLLVGEAEDGAIAIKLCGEIKPDVVLMDMVLPDMDGAEVCAKLKNDPATRDIPVVMVTGLTRLNMVIGSAAVLS